VFICKDALSQEYLCYLVEGRLVCVKLGWTNQRQPDLIVGTIHTIPAKDATPIPVRLYLEPYEILVFNYYKLI
jgi:hypothetical protein